MTFYKKFAHTSVLVAMTSLAFGACTSKKSGSTNTAALLGVVDGKEVTVADLSETEKNALYKTQKQFYDATENLLSEHYFNSYLEDYRKKNNLASADEAKKHFLNANANVSQADVDKFLKDNAASPQLKQIPEDKRVEIVSNYLKQMAQSKATQAVLQSALKDGKIVVKNMDKPLAPTFTFKTDGYSLLTNVKAPVTIVEFADYQCPYCVMAHSEIQKVLEHYNKNNQAKVQFVYYDFPLSFHEQAVPASVAAYCASQQGQFWTMHDKIFARQPRDPLTADTFSTHAESLKLDMVAFKKCQEDKKSVEAVNAQMAEGVRVGVQGTPAIYINGVRYDKQTSFEGLKTEIDALM